MRMSGLILAFVLWYLIMTVWFINATVEPGEFKDIVSGFGWVLFILISLVLALIWWVFLLHKDTRDDVFNFLGLG